MAGYDPWEALARLRHEFGEHGGVNPSIEASTTFTVMDPAIMPQIFAGRLGPDHGGCYLYGRHYNPTVYALASQIAALDGAETAYCTSSGLGAISSALLQCTDAGDHIVASRGVYGGTFALMKDYLPRKTGIETTFVDITDHAAVEAAFTDRTRVLYAETLANPTLAVADIPGLARIAHAHDAKLVIDNTFAPCLVSPAVLGADVVVHSLTKFVSGGSDIIAGAVSGSTEFMTSLMDLHEGSLMLLGPTMDPQTAFQLMLRVPHLPLRMREHSRRAQHFAERIEALGLRVHYPGLPSHPGHELYWRIANEGYGAGGILAVDLEEEGRASEFMSALQNEERFGFMAVSLGYFDTLMSVSGSSTASEMPEEERERAGITPGLVRLSIGYTGTLEQRWSQFEHMLEKHHFV